MQTFTFKTIAIAHTPFNEKFAIPRQSGLVDIPGRIELIPPYNNKEAVSELDKVSHIWLFFVFSEHRAESSKLTVRPPRLGGNKRVGVFATRSSYRPNPVGLSLVKLKGIEVVEDKVELLVEGIDLLDGTPIIDIKPYLPYADINVEAVNNLALDRPDIEKLSVEWGANALHQLKLLKGTQYEEIRQWITRLIGLDPRPAYRDGECGKEYGMSVFGLNIRWQLVTEREVCINSIDLPPSF